ncbi:MAG: hypothetical protein OEZ25_07785, partial [Candidatus Bathyarchaeota archaeon]|nr:hypothetical protein [Candidatus Bathyarchaeota archaeon]
MAARKLQNPRLLQIHFHTLRHWKATLEYHRTKDPNYVKNLLGHKNIQNAGIYRNLEQAIFDERNDKFHSTTAETVEKARRVIEARFEYVLTYNDMMLFRKRKQKVYYLMSEPTICSFSMLLYVSMYSLPFFVIVYTFLVLPPCCCFWLVR